MDSWGLNFREARVCVKDAIEKALKEHEETLINDRKYNEKKRQEIFLYLTCPVIFCVLLFSIAIGIGISPSMRTGLILTVILLAFVAAFNTWILSRVLNTKKTELSSEVRKILTDYMDWLEVYAPSPGNMSSNMNSNMSTNLNTNANPNTNPNLFSHGSARLHSHITTHGMVLGHPHVSLVSCWRNGLWQRIPVLLLAEGDVISLMGGDSTPGLVNELLPTSKASSISGEPISWKIGSKIKAGQTIRLRRSSDSNQKHGGKSQPNYAQHSFVKHRSLPPDSIELLILSGDIRCFQMAETPISSFIKTVLSSHDKVDHVARKDLSFFEKTDKEKSGQCGGQSYIRKLFALVLRIAIFKFLPVILTLYGIAVVIRLSIFTSARINWAHTVLIPIGVIIMCFIPMSIPLVVLISESLVMGDILATTEASLEEHLKNSASASAPVPTSAAATAPIATTTTATTITMTSSPYNQVPISNDLRLHDEQHEVIKVIGDRHSSHSLHIPKENRSDRSNSSNSSSSSEDDEFLDEDIDEREEEIAEEASKLVSWKRFTQYVFHIFNTRLGFKHHISWLRIFGPVRPFLPIPLIQARLLETLGAVTMVCFVDDDIICEGYSVTEEIFLLISGEKEATTGRKGTILDLHANPEAKGSRFENPQWWKYLPNLKPIALNSMLTYSSTMSTDVLLRETPHYLKRRHYPRPSATDPIPIFDGISQQMIPLVTTRSKTKSTDVNSNSRREATEMEKELVRHVRKTIPLESLKELSEEIGFLPEDANMFTKLFELNVLAPRLGDAQLLEDYHAWGQEETRRRGTLLAQVRSVIVKDARGGLQMMSQGDPSLILKYCREFWDGASIAPLNTGDREDILNLYDRYRKEDFDVVCFAYSPIPVALQPLILAAVSRNMELVSAEKNRKNPILLSTFNEDEVQCLLFVDPSTASDLMEANTKPSIPKASRRRLSQSSKESYLKPSTPFKNKSIPSSVPNFRPSTSSDASLSDNLRSGELNPSMEFSTIYEHEKTIDEFVDIEKPMIQSVRSPYRDKVGISSASPTIQDITRLLDTLQAVESPRLMSPNGMEKTLTPPLSTLSGAKVARLLSYEMRSHSDSNLTKTLLLYPETIMLTNSESLNCETLIHEMEQLDNHEDLSVLHEDGMTNSVESSSVSSSVRILKAVMDEESVKQNRWSDMVFSDKKIQNNNNNNNNNNGNGNGDHSNQEDDEEEDENSLNIFTSSSVLQVIPIKPDYLEDSFQDAEILDESLMEAEEAEEERPRRHSFDDETVSELMSSANRAKSLSLDGDDLTLAPIPVKSSSFADILLSDHSDSRPDSRLDSLGRNSDDMRGMIKIDSENDRMRSGNKNNHHKTTPSISTSILTSTLTSSSSPILLQGRLRTKSLDSFPPDEVFTEDMLVLSQSIDDRRADHMNASNITDKDKDSYNDNIIENKISRDWSGNSNNNNDDNNNNSNSTDRSIYGTSVYGSSSSTTSSSPSSSPLQSSPSSLLPLPLPLSSPSLSSSSSSLLLTSKKTGSGKRIPDQVISSLQYKYRVSSNAISQSIKRNSKRMNSNNPNNPNNPSLTNGNHNHNPSHTPNYNLNLSLKHPMKGNGMNNISDNTPHDSRKRSLGAQLWPLMRQQVFLGLAASSVPVKPEVPNLLENLNSAGVRFIYFSPRNMRRSKPVAEKIGIQFDWNCAISLRPLGHNDEHDPHRYISSYADWDVHAKMPHGVEAIKKHLQEVDNVPLLVNLYTDATPNTTCEMIEVFKAYGEVVLTIGSSLRANNQSIFHKSDVGVAVAMLPGSSSHIPSTVDSVLSRIPLYSEISLSQSDLILTFRLVGLGSIPLLQLPSTLTKDMYRKPSHRYHRISLIPHVIVTPEPEQLRLSAITETIRKGRLFLLNILQAFGFLCICTLALALWPFIAQAIPMNIPPSISPSVSLLFLLWYFPIMSVTLVLSDTSEGVMKNTPRKSYLHQKVGDEPRFLFYLLLRVSFIILSVFLQGWFTAASTFKSPDTSWKLSMVRVIHIDLGNDRQQYPTALTGQNRLDLFGYWLVQDMMSSQLLLQTISQASTLIERGQKMSKLPSIIEHSHFYIASLVLLLTHLWIMAIRVITRIEGSSVTSHHTYSRLDWEVWIILFLLPILGIGLGLLVNRLDDKSYRRYLQFLRLEFDTKLGMHSPK